MIGRLSGILVEKQPPQVVVDVSGVGYEVDVPMSTFYVLPHLNEKVTLYTHPVVREDAHLLYGFATKGERETFRQVLKISGIGPKIALAILSGMNADELAIAIAGEDIARLSRIPGIGKKTAERLVLELRGKLSFDAAGGTIPAGSLPLPSAASERSDIINALLALGYNEREAAAAIKGLPGDVGVSDGIRMALKSLAKV
ncbi:Holliday junction DNA helicase RuvA [Chitinivorax tropicus]|uniref:Holliday junction branch migration complex subunit RuvA n=1 Tax=Chitinivorax tropicus TaxID=714531 RepID=A0A840MJD9_9PROT|nr:Holliday junction branch migration protein RuvA [Chitinivorax tropicus]MBB5017299.1 Holliday junction DNA helicase RuvA [Chitinivorax tropicus]